MARRLFWPDGAKFQCPLLLWRDQRRMNVWIICWDQKGGHCRKVRLGGIFDSRTSGTVNKSNQRPQDRLQWVMCLHARPRVRINNTLYNLYGPCKLCMCISIMHGISHTMHILMKSSVFPPFSLKRHGNNKTAAASWIPSNKIQLSIKDIPS